MKSQRILVIDRDETSAKEIGRALEEKGYEVARAGTVREGIRVLAALHPQLMIMTKHALSQDEDILICFREASGVPLLMIGAREDEVEMLERGVDAYMRVPASLIELAARVQSMLRLRRHPIAAAGTSGVHDPPVENPRSSSYRHG
jgi:DNA-binding response OmpR family regulator